MTTVAGGNVIASVDGDGQFTVQAQENKPKKKSKMRRFLGKFSVRNLFPKSFTNSKPQRITAYLPPLSEADIKSGKKTLVLDLDETLVHSSFQPVPNADFVVPVKIGRVTHHAYVAKRPGCEEFLKAVGRWYEVVIFTASLSKYADPVVDRIDPTRVVTSRLFREACVPHAGCFVKDLSLLGRDLSKTIIIDNAPTSYMFQPGNAIPCTSWFNDPDDTELNELVTVLEAIEPYDDVVDVLKRILTQEQDQEEDSGDEEFYNQSRVPNAEE